MLIAGFLLTVAGIITLKVLLKIRSFPKEQTYSKGLADILPGIDRSHGAVRSGDGKTLKPESRTSSTFLESL